MTDIDPALALKILNVKLGSILKIAEEKYGIRDTSYSICGVSYTEEGFPHTWFPFLSSKVVGIRVMDICKNDINRGLYQLAHEIIHCLCPHREINANVFEEGSQLTSQLNIWTNMRSNRIGILPKLIINMY